MIINFYMSGACYIITAHAAGKLITQESFSLYTEFTRRLDELLGA